MREILVGSKVLPLNALYVVGKVWYRFNAPYAVPKSIAIVRDGKTKELKTNLTEEERKKLEEIISKTFHFQAIVMKFEDLEKQIDEAYRKELMQAKAEGKIIFSFADALYNKIAEIMKNKDPLEFEI